jgi:hypothetical protein
MILFFKRNENVNNSKSNTQIDVITILLLLIFIGLRGHIYSDWMSYYPRFESLPTLWSGDILKAILIGDMEPGFLLYAIIIKSFFPNYFIWVFINTVIDLWVLQWIFKKYTNYYVLAFIVFFAMNGLMIEFNLYRNAKAIMLFLISVEYLRNRKFVPYLILNLIGACFHYSAFIFIPLYFFIHLKVPRLLVWAIFIVSNLIFLLQIKWIGLFLGDLVSIINISMIAEKTAIYSDSASEFVFSLGYFERVFSFLFFAFFYNKIINENPVNIIFFNLFLLYFLFIFCFYEISVFSERFSFLFCISYWILYPNVYTAIIQKRTKYIFLGVFFLFLLFKTAAANKNILARYDNVLWGIRSFDERTIDFDQYSDFIDQ